MNSVNTNVGAMVALQSLNATNNDLSVVQSRINTGKKINNAKDNGAIWAIAQGQRAESQSINPVKESLQRGISTVDVAMSAAESVSDLLIQMKEKALAATDTGLTATSRKQLEADYIALGKQIVTVVDNASFNGVNMLKGSSVTAAGTSVRSLANASATSTINVDGVNLQMVQVATTGRPVRHQPWAYTTGNAVAYEDISSSFSGIKLSLGEKVFTGSSALAAGSDNPFTAATGDAFQAMTADEVDAARAKKIVSNIDEQIKKVSDDLTKLGTGSKALSAHLGFMSKLQDTLDAGVGNLVDADLAKESARLQALQTKQQLGVQALSIANQSAGILLGLFR
jgi:flagellin